MKPLVKWAGGKTAMLDVLLPRILERRGATGVYFEPFLGGGAVALALPDYVDVVASDACFELVEMWNEVGTNAYAVSRALELHRCAHSPAYYYTVRSRRYADGSDRAARFIYLNKMGFNGLFRKNRMGEFNVPLGRGRPSSIPTYGELKAVQSRMHAFWAPVDCCDFEETVERATEGDVVYADPPYDGTFDYSSQFSDDDRERLSACLRRAARRGVGVVVTDADTPRTRRAYRWMSLQPYGERRRIAANGDRRDAECLMGVRP